jgi:hypothetical protein
MKYVEHFDEVTPHTFLSVTGKYLNEIRERKTSISVFVSAVLPGKKQDSGGPATLPRSQTRPTKTKTTFDADFAHPRILIFRGRIINNCGVE